MVSKKEKDFYIAELDLFDILNDDECGDFLYLRSSYLCDDDIAAWCGVDNEKPLISPYSKWSYCEELSE